MSDPFRTAESFFMRIRSHLPRGVRLFHWTLALVVVPPLAALWSGSTAVVPRPGIGSGAPSPSARPYLRVVGVVPLRFKIDLPPAPAIQRPPAAQPPATPALPPPPAEPAAPPAAALPPPGPAAAETARKVAEPAAPAPRATEPLLLDENQAKTPDEEILRYFRFPGADGLRLPPPPQEPPSSATYRQQ